MSSVAAAVTAAFLMNRNATLHSMKQDVRLNAYTIRSQNQTSTGAYPRGGGLGERQRRVPQQARRRVGQVALFDKGGEAQR